jgi:hypothetical protein
MSIHTTPLPAAATCAVFGSVIGDGLGLGETDGAELGVAPGVAAAPGVALAVVVGVGVASVAPPPHALIKSATARRMGLVTRESICSCDARCVSGVPSNAYPERTTCAE